MIKRVTYQPSWPGLSRPSTSSFVVKTWMPAFAGMTRD